MSVAFKTSIVNNSGSVARSIAMFASRMGFSTTADTVV